MRALYGMFLAAQVTKGRLAALGALGLLALLLGLAVGASDGARPLDDGITLVSGYGLSLFVPVTTLMLASATLGEPNEDGTLVYLWLRPLARWHLVAAAVAASLTIGVPVVVIPLALAAAATGAGSGLVAATFASCTLGVVAYGCVFTWLGLRVKRALVWGLGYILVWEGFVARAGGTASLLALRTHTRSLLARLAGGSNDLVEVSIVTSVALPLLAAAVAALLATRRLNRQDVA